MIRPLMACVALFVVTASGPVLAQQQQGDARLAAVIAAYEQLERRVDPLTAGGEGDRAALRRLPDASPEAAAALKRDLTALRTQLAQVPDHGLNDADTINRAFLMRVISEGIEEIDFDDARMPISNGDGYFTLLSSLAYNTPIQSADDAEAWIARLQAAPLWYQQNLANARRGIATGWVQPRIVSERALATARAQLNSLTDTLLLPFAQMPPTIPAADQQRYRDRARAIIHDQILPQQQATVTFLQNEYLPHSRTTIGLNAIPNGRAYYSFLARSFTTTTMTPEQIHALGESEVARIRAEMEQEIRASGFHGDFAAFVNFLHTDPQFYARTGEELTMRYAETAKRADAQLPRLFGTLPRLTYGIRVIPAETAEGSTTAYYTQGSPALGQSGTYWINLTHLNQRPLYEMSALTLHESVPGHHLQIALAQEQGELPYYRRNANVTAFIEGWGLYAESLGEDMGMYRTPYERFGRLSYEMWRACRLVADTGIHWMGWDIERARQCFAQNTALSPHNIQTELERYVATPGQALAYKIGELNFQTLRREATQALGPRFNIRAFHDELLGAGALPIDLLDTRVRAWIAAQSERR
ncbi:MAG: DUF885 family protein [Proteobacteria bacterium]|nr:DUF885 family protein [Pseudomonadota bacterium]